MKQGFRIQHNAQFCNNDIFNPQHNEIPLQYYSAGLSPWSSTQCNTHKAVPFTDVCTLKICTEIKTVSLNSLGKNCKVLFMDCKVYIKCLSNLLVSQVLTILKMSHTEPQATTMPQTQTSTGSCGTRDPWSLCTCSSPTCCREGGCRPCFQWMTALRRSQIILT